MIPWREQLAAGWRVARWVIWPPDLPLWGHLVYKISQVVMVASVAIGSVWILAAVVVLSLATAITVYWGQG